MTVLKGGADLPTTGLATASAGRSSKVDSNITIVFGWKIAQDEDEGCWLQSPKSLRYIGMLQQICGCGRCRRYCVD